MYLASHSLLSLGRAVDCGLPFLASPLVVVRETTINVA
jgi:hypothetical protein